MAPIRISDIADASPQPMLAPSDCLHLALAYPVVGVPGDPTDHERHGDRPPQPARRVPRRPRVVDLDPLRLGLVPSPADGLVAEQLRLQPGIGLLRRRRHGSSVRPMRPERDGRADCRRSAGCAPHHHSPAPSDAYAAPGWTADADDAADDLSAELSPTRVPLRPAAPRAGAPDPLEASGAEGCGPVGGLVWYRDERATRAPPAVAGAASRHERRRVAIPPISTGCPAAARTGPDSTREVVTRRATPCEPPRARRPPATAQPPFRDTGLTSSAIPDSLGGHSATKHWSAGAVVAR